MTDHMHELYEYIGGLDEGDEIGTAIELRRGTPKAVADLTPRLLLELGLARQGRYKKLLRTAKDVPKLGDFRLASTHVYNIKFIREGSPRIRYTKCRAGRLDKKLRRMAAAEEVKILSVSEAWMTPWSPANRELSERGIPKYRQVAG